MIFENLITDPRIRAAGLWRAVTSELVQVAFWHHPDMPSEVAQGFAEATRLVSLSQTSLGIVGAVLDGRPRISVAEDLPPDAGSGLWLRRFGADRSVAVPWTREGVPIAVVSVAIRGREDESLIKTLRDFLETGAGGSGLWTSGIPE